MAKTLVISGAAGGDSKTMELLNLYAGLGKYQHVELHQLQIAHYPFDYSSGAKDDFRSVVEKMLIADFIVFATPVYWYAMSGRMKVFFDRLTELMTISKQDGRALKGKECFLFFSGASASPPQGFEVPFQKTSEYFEMNFKGQLYLKSTRFILR